jgi:hypothetical protein
MCQNVINQKINLKYKNNKIKQKCRAYRNNTYLVDCKEEIMNIFKNI